MLPCFSGGAHRDTYPAPTENEEPAIPSAKAAPKIAGQVVNEGTKAAAIADTKRRIVKTNRPPKRSVSIPIGKRANEPNSTGTAINVAI
jgi:hypothetical protein